MPQALPQDGTKCQFFQEKCQYWDFMEARVQEGTCSFWDSSPKIVHASQDGLLVLDNRVYKNCPIFTNSAPMGRVGPRVAMSVVVCLVPCHREPPTSGGRVDLWSKIEFLILVWDDTIFKKRGGPIFFRDC